MVGLHARELKFPRACEKLRGKCPNLKYLDLRFVADNFYLDPLEGVLQSFGHTLRSFKLFVYSKVFPWRLFAFLRSLTNLSIYNHFELVPDCVNILGQLRQLRYFTITYCSLEVLHALSLEIPLLNGLEIRRVIDLELAGTIELLESSQTFPELRELNLFRAGRIGVQGLENLCRKRRLNVSSNDMFETHSVIH